MTASFALKDIAKLLGVHPYRIQYAYVNGLVKEPELRLSNRRVYQEQDLEMLAKHFGVKLGEAVTADPAE